MDSPEKGSRPEASSRPTRLPIGTCSNPTSTCDRINHSEAYSRDGAHTNLAESYFSRLRRMIGGQHLRVEGRYLDAYAAHAAWLEDHRDESNGALGGSLIGGALAAPVSRTGRATGNDAQRDRVAGRPDTHALAASRPSDELAPLGVTQRLDDLEDHRVPQRVSESVEIALDHHPLGEFPRRHLAVNLEMPTQMSAISPFLKNPWLTMYRARWRSRARRTARSSRSRAPGRAWPARSGPRRPRSARGSRRASPSRTEQPAARPCRH